MGKVIFLMNVSLDGYIERSDHSLDWTINDDELDFDRTTSGIDLPLVHRHVEPFHLKRHSRAGTWTQIA